MPEVTAALDKDFFYGCDALRTLIVPQITGTLHNAAFAAAFGGNISGAGYDSIDQLTIYTRRDSTVESLFRAKTNGMQNVGIKYLDQAPQISAQNGQELIFADAARAADWRLVRDYGFDDYPPELKAYDVTALDALFAVHKAKYGDAFTPETYTAYLDIDADGNVTKAFGEDKNGSFGFSVNGAVPLTSLAATVVTDTDTLHFFSGETQSSYNFTRGGTPIHEITMMPNTDYVLTVTSSSGAPVANAPVYAALDPAGTVEGFAQKGATDANGAITLNFAQGGAYIVYAKQSGYVFTALRATVQAADTRFGAFGATGDVPFETLTKLESGINAGTLVKIDAEGAGGTAGFDPDHPAYNYHVNANISVLDFNFTANQAVYEQGLTLAVAVNGEPLEGFTAAAPDTWSAIPVTLLDGEDSATPVTFTVTYVESGQTYTQTYTVNVIKSENTAHSWYLAFEPTGRTRGSSVFDYIEVATLESNMDKTLLVYKGDEFATVNVKISAGNELLIENVKQTPVAEDQRFGAWLVDEYALSFPVPRDLTGKNPNALIVERYNVTVRTPGGESTTKEAQVTLRSHYDGIFTPDRMIEYKPALGQFIYRLSLPEYANSVLHADTHYIGSIISLGGFGGYIVAEYDDPITNNPNNPYGIDFIVYGNAFEGGKVSEPGSVEVSYDGNNWYYLAGSNHYELNAAFDQDATLRDGEIVKSMRLLREIGYPSVTFGYADVSSCSEVANAGYLWGVKGEIYNPYTADLKGNIGDGFDLSWAVDAEGRPVELPDGIKYIRIQNIIDVQENQAFGEVSPEICTIIKIRPQDQLTPVGVTDAPKSIKINGKTLDELGLTPEPNYSFNDGQVTYYWLDLTEENIEGGSFRVNVEGADENDNIYVNAVRGVGTLEYNALVDAEGSRTVRVIAQNGEKAARIYVIKSATGGNPADNTDIDSIALTPQEGEWTWREGNYTGRVGPSVDGIALTVKALNYESAITLSGDGIAGGSVKLTHGESSEVIPVKVGTNRFTVTITSANGKYSNPYEVVILRDPGYTLPLLDTAADGTGAAVAGSLVSGEKFNDLAAAIAGGGGLPDNTPANIGVRLTEAKGITISPPPADPSDTDAAIKFWEDIKNEGLETMLEKGAIAVSSAGDIIANVETALGIIEETEPVEYDAVVPLIGLKAEVPEPDNSGDYQTGVITYEGVFEVFEGVAAGRIDVFKLTTEDKIHHFKSAPSLSAISAGEFVITDASGNKIPSAEPLAGDEKLFMAIKDNSYLDWNEYEGEIFDPASVGSISRSASSGSGGGGCDAGFGASAVAVTLLAVFAARRGRKR